MGRARDRRALERALARMEAILAWPDGRLHAKDPVVSGWSPAQHVEHTLAALERILAAVEMLRRGEGEAIRAEGRPTLAGRLVLWMGRIPRGRAQAPEETVPRPAPARHAVRERLRAVAARFGDIAPQAGTLRRVAGVIDHPALGGLTAARWWRFARIHTDHHLTIVDDIDRRGRRVETVPDLPEPLGDTA